MKNSIKYFLAIAGMLIFLTSCEEEDKTWQGQQVGFEVASGNLMIPIEVSTTYSRTFKVALIAAPQASDVTVSFEVDPSSTAVEGTHFQLPSSSVTIPAGQSFAEFTVVAINSGFAFGGDFRRLVLRVAGASIDVAENFSRFTLTISKESFIDSFAGAFEAYEFVPSNLEEPVYGPYNVTCTPIPGTNNLNLEPMYDWADRPVVAQFNPNDNTITVDLQLFNPGVGSGLSVDATGFFNLQNQTFELTANIYNGDDLFDITHIKYSRPGKSDAPAQKHKSEIIGF